MVFGSQPATFEAHLAADPDLVYHALFEIVLEQHTIRDHDDELRLITFGSRTSAFTWGEDTIAEVIEEDTSGSTLRLTVSGRHASMLHAGVLQQTGNDLIAAVSAHIRLLNAADSSTTLITIDYRRADGTQGRVTCSPATYEEQITRVALRGYTILEVVR